MLSINSTCRRRVPHVSVIILLCIVLFVQSTRGQSEDEDYVKIQSELELIQWDLQDECSDMARNTKSFYLHEVTGLRDKIRGEVDHANFLRIHSERLKVYEEVPYDMQRNWTYFTKCGDVLLSSDEYKALTVFANKNLELKTTDKIEFTDNGEIQMLDESDVMHALATRRNTSELEDIWKKWESGTKPFKNWYYEALKLVNKATLANDHTEVENYWEMLSEMPSGYELGYTLFEAIQPLYNKLHNFVRLRINKHYNTTYEDYFPAYLTGSFLGDDWSNIADILLPNPQLYYDMKVEIGARDIEDLYKYASNATKNLGFGEVVNPNFLKRSNLHSHNCDTKILDYCAEHYSSIITCDKTTIANYFNTYETVMQLGLTKVNFPTKVNQNLRFSPVLEGMQSMASLMSVSGLLQNNIVFEKAFMDHVIGEDNRMTIMLLLALRILPKIAYYHAMDKFRLDLLENHGEVGEIHRKYLKNIQGLLPVDGVESTAEYLRDDAILFNRPYLSKMLGLFLQFQMLNYFQINIFEDADISTLFNKDTTFRDFVLNMPNRDAQDLLSYYYNIDEISDYPLLNFFAPLDAYLDVAPMEQAAYKIKTPKFVKTTTTTTTTEISKTKKSKAKMVATEKPTEFIQEKSNVKSNIINLNNETMIDSNVTRQEDHLIPVEKSIHAGIYIGAGIVVITLAIIAAGFVKQRRSQRNNRRYNA